MLRPFLSIKKVKQWFIDNKPEDVLLAMFNDGTIPILISDDGVEQLVYLSMDDDSDNGVSEIEVEIIDDLRFKALIVPSEEGDPYTRVFTQPERDAWIEWKEV